MRGRAVERENEYVAEHLANGAGLDFRPLGGPTVAALLLPISVKFLANSVFHERTLDAYACCRGQCDVCPRLGQIPAFADDGDLARAIATISN